jgi:tripartite-type tricarboxylate transporter receptor subunit TctC
VWWGFLAPAHLPPAVKDRLAKDCAEVARLPAMKERFFQLGASPVGSTPDEFAALIRGEFDKWGPIIKAAGIKAE